MWPSANCPHKWVSDSFRIFHQCSESKVEIDRKGRKEAGGVGPMNDGGGASELMSWAVSSALKWGWTKLSLKDSFSYKII